VIPVDAIEATARSAHELWSQQHSRWDDLTEGRKDAYRDEARTVMMILHPEWRPNGYEGAAE
jgi:hypothetical protein